MLILLCHGTRAAPPAQCDHLWTNLTPNPLRSPFGLSRQPTGIVTGHSTRQCSAMDGEGNVVVQRAYLAHADGVATLTLPCYGSMSYHQDRCCCQP